MKYSRNKYIPGEQVETTEQVRRIAESIVVRTLPECLLECNEVIFSKLRILPYISEYTTTEEKIRWKRSATEILESGVVYDTKYCTDVTIVMISICKALGYRAELLKVFQKDEKTTEIIVHSFALVSDDFAAKQYIVNVAPNKDFFYKRVHESEQLIRGHVCIRKFVVWNIAADQWAMGLTDASHEQQIIDDAERYYKGLSV